MAPLVAPSAKPAPTPTRRRSRAKPKPPRQRNVVRHELKGLGGFVVEWALMVLVDSSWALGAGVALMIAFIAIGAAAIATPEYLGRDDDWNEEP